MAQHPLLGSPLDLHRMVLTFTDHTIGDLSDEVSVQVAVAPLDGDPTTVGRLAYPAMTRDLLSSHVPLLTDLWLFDTRRNLIRQIPQLQKATRKYLAAHSD